MRINSGIFLIIIFVLSACSSLKKSQVQATENFALATKGISRIPSDIYFRIYQLKSESQSLLLSTALSTNNEVNESIQLLKNEYDEKMKFIKIAEEYSAAYLIVEEYATLVLCLLNEDYLRAFEKSKASWQISFDNLIKRYNSVSVKKIPASLGRFTGSVVEEIGKLKIKQLQKRYLKEAIHTSRLPFENICDNFILLDSLKIRGELNNLPAYLDNNYANFLENLRAYEEQGNNPFHFYNTYSPVYFSWLSQLNELDDLSTNTITAFRTLRKTIGILETFIDGNGSQKIPNEIYELMENYAALQNTYQSFQNKREKLDTRGLIK